MLICLFDCCVHHLHFQPQILFIDQHWQIRWDPQVPLHGRVPGRHARGAGSTADNGADNTSSCGGRGLMPYRSCQIIAWGSASYPHRRDKHILVHIFHTIRHAYGVLLCPLRRIMHPSATLIPSPQWVACELGIGPVGINQTAGRVMSMENCCFLHQVRISAFPSSLPSAFTC